MELKYQYDGSMNKVVFKVLYILVLKERKHQEILSYLDSSGRRM
jgi:hypothetical protein